MIGRYGTVAEGVFAAASGHTLTRTQIDKSHLDLAVELDVGLVGDVPTKGEEEYSACLGAGPTLVHKDLYVHYDKQLLWSFVDVAQANNIPIQHGVYNNYGSDAVALRDHGIPALLIGVPTRSTHTAFEMVEESDIVSTFNLLQCFVNKSSGGLLARVAANGENGENSQVNNVLQQASEDPMP